METVKYLREKVAHLRDDEAFNVTQLRADGVGLRKVNFNPSTARSLVQIPYHPQFVFNLSRGYQGLDNFLRLQGYNRKKIEKIHQDLSRISSPTRSSQKRSSDREISHGHQSSILLPFDTLTPNQYLISPNGKYKFWYQNDGNLIVTGPGLLRRILPCGNYGTDEFQPKGTLVYDDSGQLIIYTNYESGKGTAVWSTSTQYTGHNPYLVLTDDGDLISYGDDKIIWSCPKVGDEKINFAFTQGVYAGICDQNGSDCNSCTKPLTLQNNPDYKKGYAEGVSLALDVYSTATSLSKFGLNFNLQEYFGEKLEKYKGSSLSECINKALINLASKAYRENLS